MQNARALDLFFVLYSLASEDMLPCPGRGTSTLWVGVNSLKGLLKHCVVTSGEEAQLVDIVETQALLSNYCRYCAVRKKAV